MDCYIVGAGGLFGRRFSPSAGDYIIAADGGYDALLGLGITPDLVIGDFDSAVAVPNHPNVVRLNKEKDDTDMLAALRDGFDRGYRAFHLYGGTGGRMDHTLANIQCLCWLSARGARGWLHGDGWVITAITDGSVDFDAGHTGFVSVFCMGDTAQGVTLRGLKYPLTEAVLTMDMPLGVSNEFMGAPSQVTVGRGTLGVLFYE